MPESPSSFLHPPSPLLFSTPSRFRSCWCLFRFSCSLLPSRACWCFSRALLPPLPPPRLAASLCAPSILSSGQSLAYRSSISPRPFSRFGHSVASLTKSVTHRVSYTTWREGEQTWTRPPILCRAHPQFSKQSHLIRPVQNALKVSISCDRLCFISSKINPSHHCVVIPFACSVRRAFVPAIRLS